MNHEEHKVHEAIDARTESVARQVVDAGISVHRALGPGLLESSYEHCLAYELYERGLQVERQRELPLVYGEVRLDAGYRIDLLVEDRVIVEVKAIEAIAPIHDAQVPTYLKLSGRRLGFLMNFNVTLFKNGLRRIIL